MQLAIALRSGTLPVTLKVIEERTVGPQLGADSIRAGVIASIIAAVAVVVFMLVTYGRFGVYANFAVVMNIFVILGGDGDVQRHADLARHRRLRADRSAPRSTPTC